MIIPYLRGDKPDMYGRWLTDVLRWSDAKWEHSHDVIQWVFPLNEPSNYNEEAPVLTDFDIEIIQGDEQIKANLIRSLNRYLLFLENPQWITPHNHNFLRITRVLKCLKLAGLEDARKSFKEYLEVIYSRHENIIGLTTIQFWRNA
jgi:hypothetical protein